MLLEGGDLAELMVHVRAEFGPTARIIRADRVRSGGLVGFFARERYELTVDVPDEPLARPRATRLPVPAAAGPVGIDALLAAVEAAEARHQIGAAGSTPGPDAGSPLVSTGADAFASVLEQVRAMTGAQGLTADVEVPAPPARVFEPMVPVQVEVPVAAPAGTTRSALLDLGVPERMLAGIAEAAPLSVLLANVPAAPDLPRTPGSVVVVVGAGREAAAVGAQVVERLRLAPTSLVVAGEGEPSTGRVRRLTDTAAAARWRVMPDGGQIRVVALAVGPDPRDRAVAAELLAALDPDQVWGVVDARTKTRDCARWLTEVGERRRVDALAVRGLFETTQPGTVLDLGVPVAWFDGIPATGVAWAAALSQHLQPGVRWD
ncbi:hypothetical protein DDP54_10765 [Cellulomonas sp. WB94]|nr:hypothetical protein DDP54_10765 [Cellulomonas sp. WB94]